MPTTTGSRAGGPLLGLEGHRAHRKRSCAAPMRRSLYRRKVATAARKRAGYSRSSIVDGKVRSSFAMTEPTPGAGSDASMMQTTAGLPKTSTRKIQKYLLREIARQRIEGTR